MSVLGKHNPRVKTLCQLSRRCYREQEEKFIAEGPRLVNEALASTWPVEGIYYTARFAGSSLGTDLIAQADMKGISAYEISPEVLGRITATDQPQGVLCVVRVQKAVLHDVVHDRASLVVVVDGVQDPGNLGTIIRSAQAAGATGAILLAGTVDLYNAKTIRATAGAVFRFPVVQGICWAEALNFFRQVGLELVVADPRGAIPMYQANLTEPVALVIGSEVSGPDAAARCAAANHIFVPMPGKTESLNVAVAASLLLYEAVRQRHEF